MQYIGTCITNIAGCTTAVVGTRVPSYMYVGTYTHRSVEAPPNRMYRTLLYMCTACYIGNTSTYEIHQYTLAIRLQLGVAC